MSYDFAARVLGFDDVFADRDTLSFSGLSGMGGRFGRPQAVVDDYRDSIRDTTAPFGQLAAGGSVTGNVEERGDRDVFSVSLTAGQQVTFNLTGGSSASGLLSDPLLRLMNSTGTVIASNDDFGGSRNSRITFTASSSGTYYLDAGGYGSSQTGRYTLSASGTATTPADDYRDSLSDTTAPFGTLAIGGSSTGRIETSGDTDMFSVALTQGQTYTFNLAGSGSGAIANPALKLFNGSGTQIAANDDAGGALSSAISFTAAASGTYYLQAAGSTSVQTGAYQLSAADTTATTPSPSASGAFDIVVRYSGDARYQAAFEQAAARWEQVITGDLPDFNSSQFGSIDDLLIDASAIAIDGAGGVLGRAGPDQVRSGSMLPVHGIMEFDSADLAGMAANGTLVNVILHEMGHVLGLGTLWDNLGLKSSNTQYTGANALREYRTLSGNSAATFVPLENDGGPGTAGGHWEEDIFGTELMTGFANGTLPMSRMTIGALQDLGYQVNYAAADAYSLPNRSLGLQSSGQQTLHHADDAVFGMI